MTNAQPSASQPPKVSKGASLELRVARLMLAQGITPFLNVFFRSQQEAAGVKTPDIDVMGCVVLPDGTMLHTHVDCKSGDSAVISRILLLQGLRRRMPPGPILYVRPNTKLDLKRMALEEDIRVADIAEVAAREDQLVTPAFGKAFPSLSDPDLAASYYRIKGRSKKVQLGRILNYLETEFWLERPFTRLKRSIAAVELLQTASAEASISDEDESLLLMRIVRQLVYALLQATFRVAYFSESELVTSIGRWLVTEAVPIEEYRTIVESTAQYIFDAYGDPTKGPLRSQDYDLTPPDYTEELARFIQKTAFAAKALPVLLPVFDGELVERGLRRRDDVAHQMLARYSPEQVEAARVWYRGLRLFLRDRRPSVAEWEGWRALDG